MGIEGIEFATDVTAGVLSDTTRDINHVLNAEQYTDTYGSERSDLTGESAGDYGAYISDDFIGDLANIEQLDSVLDNFRDSRWSDLSLEGKKLSITELADFVAEDTGTDNPPNIVFRDDMPDGSYGGYSADTNTIEINENMLDDSAEAADTIAHEMWHAFQHQEAQDPTSEKGPEYLEGFDNYISPEYDFEAYENQMVEAEARDYAQGFKDRLSNLKGAA